LSFVDFVVELRVFVGGCFVWLVLKGAKECMLVGYVHGVEGALEVSNWLEHGSANLNKYLKFRKTRAKFLVVI